MSKSATESLFGLAVVLLGSNDTAEAIGEAVLNTARSLKAVSARVYVPGKIDHLSLIGQYGYPEKDLPCLLFISVSNSHDPVAEAFNNRQALWLKSDSLPFEDSALRSYISVYLPCCLDDKPYAVLSFTFT